MNIFLPRDTDVSPHEEVLPKVVPQPQTYHRSESVVSLEQPASTMKFFWLTIVILLVITGVGVGTYLLESDHSEPVLVNGLLTPTPNSLRPNDTAANVTDPTAKWLVYSNTTVGFTMKYPPHFEKPVEAAATITFSSPSGSYTLVVFPYTGTLEDLYEERSTNIVTKDSNIPVVFPDLPKGVMKTALLDGLKAFWYETVSDTPKEQTGREVHFVSQTTGFIFRADPEVVVNETEMEQMIMSFKNIPLAASTSAKVATPSANL